MGGQKNQFYCFTIFNTNWSLENVDKQNTRYIIYQLEEAPSTKKLHYQGYIELNRRLGLKGCKDILGEQSAHIGSRIGSAEQAREYCRKEESRVPGTEPIEWGTFGGNQGQRSDLLELKDSLDKGLKLEEVADKHFECFLKYNRSIKEYINLKKKVQRSWYSEISIFWGEPGSGKSKDAYEIDNDAYWLRRGNGGSVWWDGYDFHETVVIDDFYGWIPFDTLLRIGDRYPLFVDTKGGAVPFVAKRIIITSNSPPEQWYPNIACMPQRWGALTRRIKEQYHYSLSGGRRHEVPGNTIPGLQDASFRDELEI